MPLNPRRAIGLWATGEQINSLVADWSARELSITQARVLLEFVTTSAADLGTDIVHDAALSVTRELPRIIEGWNPVLRPIGMIVLAQTLSEFVGVLLAGAGANKLRPAIEVLQQATVALVLALKTKPEKERAGEDTAIMMLNRVRIAATRAALRAVGQGSVTPEELIAGYDAQSLELDAPTLKAETFERLAALGTAWCGGAVLLPAWRLLRQPSVKVDMANPKRLAELLAAKDFNEELHSELHRLGGLAISTLVKMLNETSDAGIAQTVLESYTLLTDVHRTDEPCALLLAADHRLMRKAIAAFLTRALEVRVADRGKFMPPKPYVVAAVSSSLRDDRVVTSLASYDSSDLLGRVFTEWMLKSGDGPSPYVGDLAGELGWQEGESAPRTLACVRDVEVARRLLKASVSLYCSEWKKNGTYLGALMGRLAGIEVRSPKDRQNPKVWLKLLDVQPDFHMFD